MAVRIDIPGIGTVNAEDAATESTLRELAKLLANSERRNAEFNTTAAKNLTATAAAASSAAAAMSGVATSATSAKRSSNELARDAKKQLEALASTSFTEQLGDGVKTLVLTLAKATTAYATNYKELSTNPIGVASATLGDAITLGTNLIGETIDGVLKGLGSLVTKIPFIGGLLDGALSGLGTLSKGVADLVGTVLNKINDVFAKELDQTINNFRTMSSMGATFTNGMMEMRIAANASGLTIDQFTSAIQKSRDSVGNLGLTFAGGAQVVAETSQQLGLLSTGGSTLRNQLLALGYTFEEQVELSADYIASVRAGTTLDKMRNIGSAELARGTREYAEDLRVLQALTKGDAKQKQEQARTAALQADIMAQLDPEAAQRFQGVLRSMPAELQKGFMEQLSLGTVVDAATNVYMSQNQAVGQMFNQMEGIIRESTMTMGQAQDASLSARATIRSEQERLVKSGEVAFNVAARAGATGVIGSVASMINSVLAETLFDTTAVDEARTATENQATAQDELTKTTTNLLEQSQQYAIQMEGIVLNYLPLYSGLLEMTNNAMITGLSKLMELAGVRTLDYDNMTVTGSLGNFEDWLAAIVDKYSPKLFGASGGIGGGGLESGLDLSSGNIMGQIVEPKTVPGANNSNLNFAEAQLLKRQKDDNITYGPGMRWKDDDGNSINTETAISTSGNNVVKAIIGMKDQNESANAKNYELLAQILNGVTDSAVTQDKIYKAVG